MTGPNCAGHGSLADELRQYADGALDVLEPLLDRIRTRQPDSEHPEPDSCAACPVCAVITVLRGGRSEMAVRLAEQLAGVLAVLRTALDEGIGADQPSAGPPPAEPYPAEPGAAEPGAAEPGAAEAWSSDGAPRPPSTRGGLAHLPHRGPRVQRIPVDRGDRWLASAPYSEPC